MQSIRQYRRLRESVKEDLRKWQDHRNGSSGSSTPHSGLDGEKPDDEVPTIPGIEVSRPSEDGPSTIFRVGWKDNDPLDPRNWSLVQKWWSMIAVSFVAIAVTIPSSIDAPVATVFNEHFGVGPMEGSLTTGMSIPNFSNLVKKM
jgi:hypothetical protein